MNITKKPRTLMIQTLSEWTPLLYAISNNEIDIVKLLANSGANINTIDSKGWSPLSFAVREGHFEIVKYLVNSGALNYLNQLSTFYKSPLTQCIYINNPEMAKFLLENGADVNKKDNLSRTPLSIATEKKNIEFMKLLIYYGANPHM